MWGDVLPTVEHVFHDTFSYTKSKDMVCLVDVQMFVSHSRAVSCYILVGF